MQIQRPLCDWENGDLLPPPAAPGLIHPLSGWIRAPRVEGWRWEDLKGRSAYEGGSRGAPSPRRRLSWLGLGASSEAACKELQASDSFVEGRRDRRLLHRFAATIPPLCNRLLAGPWAFCLRARLGPGLVSCHRMKRRRYGRGKIAKSRCCQEKNLGPAWPQRRILQTASQNA